MKNLIPIFLFPFLASVLLAASAAASGLSAGHAKIARESTFTVALPAAEAFTLFEPLGEKKWAEGWNPIFASAADATLHDGSVFMVEGVHPKGGPVQSVWCVSRYEPPYLIEYRNVLIGVRATRIRVTCAAVVEKESRITVSYEYTGLSPDGDAFIGTMTDAHFKESIVHWNESITAYLKRGTAATK